MKVLPILFALAGWAGSTSAPANAQYHPPPGNGVTRTASLNVPAPTGVHRGSIGGPTHKFGGISGVPKKSGGINGTIRPRT
jgi:hypothetical protein